MIKVCEAKVMLEAINNLALFHAIHNNNNVEAIPELVKLSDLLKMIIISEKSHKLVESTEL